MVRIRIADDELLNVRLVEPPSEMKAMTCFPNQAFVGL